MIKLKYGLKFKTFLFKISLKIISIFHIYTNKNDLLGFPNRKKKENFICDISIF